MQAEADHVPPQDSLPPFPAAGWIMPPFMPYEWAKRSTPDPLAMATRHSWREKVRMNWLPQCWNRRLLPRRTSQRS
eukprot:7381926-Prorocentrum_lima.AAC.1